MMGLLVATLGIPSTLRAETGYDAWLRYATIDDAAIRQHYDAIPAVVAVLGDSVVIRSAQQELVRGVQGMVGRMPRVEAQLPQENAIVLGTLTAIQQKAPRLEMTTELEQDGYWLKTVTSDGFRYWAITGSTDIGVLYGVFALLRKIGLEEPVAELDEKQAPYAPIRWVNQWDNLAGTIERGYGGPSIFFEKSEVRGDLSRARAYARLLASLGINGCAINNVNADPRVITTAFIPQLARVAEAFRPWGVKLAVSIDFSSPRSIGGLDTFDPLDPRVAQWWSSKADEIYRAIPDFGGFLVKADSEGRLGPSTYGRTHADAANVIARALKPHSGVIFYRGFVYDHHMDWRNLKNDRARAAYNNFYKLDGQFEDNAIVQIKQGPIDFQVREPVSPLLGALEKTNEAVELQITQEYMGQARHLCFLVPMWKEALDFDLYARGAETPMKALAAGKVFHQPVGGFVGVANVGSDINWVGHQLSQANLYGFGRLAWDPDLSARRIAQEWTQLTFGHEPKVVSTIVDMLTKSWRAYENYTGPLGAQTLTDITGSHYGPAIESSERNGWGQWHRADAEGVGMDRTVATGTGFIGQYRAPVAKLYEPLATCPDELLLFMHHVPYSYVLHSGKTVIQHIYDSHYEGAETAKEYLRQWRSLEGRIDEQRYLEVLARLEYQAGHAQVWRDAVSNWFLHTSGIPDAKGRAGHFPGRFEAEAMKLVGYAIRDVTPWEAASGGKAIECANPSRHCSASFQYEGKPGRYDLSVQYFDQNNGVSGFRLYVADRLVDGWAADDNLPTQKIDAHSSTRHKTKDLALHTGDEIRIEGDAQGGENAPLDYVEMHPTTTDPPE